MSRAIRSRLAMVAVLLAGCGGIATDEPVLQARTLASASSVAPADHEAIAQRLYLAYLGRAAEPAGLAFYAAASRKAGMKADIGAWYQDYGRNADVRQVLDSFAGSPEAIALYAQDDAATVTAMYRNLFNRDPDSGGLAFWSAALSGGALARAQLPAALLAGAHASDLALFERKAQVANAFSAALDTPELVAHYQGGGAVAALHGVLGRVDLATGELEQRALVDAALAAVAASPAFPKVQAIVRARCVACHSATPTMPGFFSAPRGIRFDTPQQLRADAYRVYVNVVQTQFMPYGNQTGMSLAEREIVRAWYEDGAL